MNWYVVCYGITTQELTQGSQATEAHKQLQPEFYTENFETRKLVRAFFGIISGRFADDSDPSVPQHQYYTPHWQKISSWHSKMAQAVQSPIAEKELQPWLACSSDLLVFQRPNDAARNPDGSIVKDSKGKSVTLEQFVKQRGLKYGTEIAV